jgi:uridylate kinase
MAAVTLCLENDLPIVVFDMNQPGQIKAAAMGERVGTLIDDAPSDGNGAVLG